MFSVYFANGKFTFKYKSTRWSRVLNGIIVMTFVWTEKNWRKKKCSKGTVLSVLDQGSLTFFFFTTGSIRYVLRHRGPNFSNRRNRLKINKNYFILLSFYNGKNCFFFFCNKSLLLNAKQFRIARILIFHGSLDQTRSSQLAASLVNVRHFNSILYLDSTYFIFSKKICSHRS